MSPIDIAPVQQAIDPARIAPSKLPQTTAKLFGRDEDLACLDAAWVVGGSTNIVVLRAWGGVGKTALVAEWLAQRAAEEWQGARWVFDWSFYSQGTRSESAGDQVDSADVMIADALTFFGDDDPQAGSPTDRGVRLARLVASERGLLVLDGVEPLQHPPGPLHGHISDPALLALLKGLAQHNAGLCLVTTREPLVELARFHGRTVEERPLESLSDLAGAELLHSLGVMRAGAKHPVDPQDRELQEASREVSGHALTLQLMGRYLQLALDGDVQQRDVFQLAEADPQWRTNTEDVDSPYGHAFRVIWAYERWWLDDSQPRSEQEQVSCRRQLAMLRLMGLFNRPANAGCLQALREQPVIEGLTEELVELDDRDWKITATRLEELGLVQCEPSSGTQFSLDAHPLVREYFAQRLKGETSWRKAHGRLFDHLCQSTEHLPDSLPGLQPLYQAIAHGCLAGRTQEAHESVYLDRVLRGEEHYTLRQLGAFGSELGGLVNFFERPWSHVSTELSEAAQSWLFNEAAFVLRALGRLNEAVEPMQAGLRMDEVQGEWKSAAAQASNLSELQLTLGAVSEAMTSAEAAVDYADRSDSVFHRYSKRTTLADALHQSGERAESLSLFREAESIQKVWQPQHPLLYGMDGFQYCDLLLADAERAAWQKTLSRKSGSSGAAGQQLSNSSKPKLARVCQEVQSRATQSLDRVQYLLSIALDRLTLSRLSLYRSILLLPNERSLDSVTFQPFDSAVESLRGANSMHHLPRGLLTRAWYLSSTCDDAAARADLDEAWEIAERGSMKLHQADIQLTRARLFGDLDALADARELITSCGYGRRLPELEDAEAVLLE